MLIMGVMTCILCLISFCLMQKELYPEEEKGVNIRKMLLPISAKRGCYLFATLVLNLVLVCFLVFFYKQSEVYIMKRVGLAVLVCGIMPVDLKTNRIPNTFILAILAWRTICLIAEVIGYRDTLGITVLQEIIGAGIFFLLIGVCMLVAKNSIGMGDLKLILVVAACQGIYGVINTLFLSMIIAFFTAILLLLTGKKGRKDVIPFAPCIMPGLYAALFLCGI